jgi:hypothetical protein
MLDQGQQMANDIEAMNYKYGGLMKYMNGGNILGTLTNVLADVGDQITGGKITGKHANGGIIKYPNGGKVNPFNISLGMGDVNAGFNYNIPKTNIGFGGNLNQQLTPLFTEGIMPTPVGNLEARFGNKDNSLNLTGSLETDFKNKPIASFRGEYNPSNNFSASGGFTGQDDNLSGDLSLNYTGKKFSTGANISGNKEGFAVGGNASYEIMPGTNIGINAKYAKNEEGKYEPTGNINLTSDFRRIKKERPLEFGKGGMIPKYANGTSGLPPGFNPALLYQVPQFAKLAKEEQDRLLGSPEMLSQYVKKNVPSAFDKKMSNYADEIESAIAEYNIQSKPLNSGAYDSGLEMFGDQLFEVVPDNFRGISPMTPIQTKGLSNNLLNQYNASMQGPKSLYMDLSGIQGTTDVKPAYLDLSGVKGTTDVKPVNETHPEEYYTGPIEPEDEDVTKTILFDRYMGPIEPEDEDVTKTIQFNKDKITDESDTSGYDFTMGDMMGFAGTGISGLGPPITTLINRAGDTPNINPYLNYGKAGLAELEKMKGAFGTIRDKNLRDIGLKSDTQRKRARSMARSVNVLKTMEDKANAREQELTSDVYTKYAGQMAGISGNIAKAMDARDRMTMMGREKQDLADRQDRDNFFTQLNKDFGNMGKAMQKVGKDLNVKQLDKDFMNILPMMNKYSISVKQDKDGTFKMYNTSSGKFLSDKEQQDFYASLRKIREPQTDAKKYAEEEEQKKQQRRNEFYKRGNLVEQDVDYNTPDKTWNYLSGLNLFGN